MPRIIKNKDVDETLIRSVGRLAVANKSLEEKLKTQDLVSIKNAASAVRVCIVDFKNVAYSVEKTPDNLVMVRSGMALAELGDSLCEESSQGLRLFFQVIQGGKR